jgi:retron-type reverse transcriptase
MSQLHALKSAVTLQEIAALLGFQTKALAYILYKKPPATKYSSFNIMKRGGGSRTINAPSPDLMLLQRRLSDILQASIEEINTTHNRKDQLAHGFKRHRSIITNASKHRKRRYVFNIDLKDFFGTINFGRVRGFFIKDKNFSLNADTATRLAQIACHENALPQGSPCSPVISNLIGHVLDLHLAKLAFNNGCTYSRYADDLTFSTNKPQFPPAIAKQIGGQGHKWDVGDKLQEIVTSAGFTINPQKTRMQYRDSRQDVTGLVVNSKVNIRSEYRRAVRAMAHRLFMTGEFEIIQGPNKQKGALKQLHGMLGHIDRVDRHNAELSRKDHGKAKAPVGIGSKENLYRRFLLFKEFYIAATPTVVCEGKTDNVYLKHAIRSLAARYPNLAAVSPNGKTALKLRIFKYPHTSTGRILQLGGGSGDLKNLIEMYRKELKRFKSPGQQNPVILLIDNDDGAKKIVSLAEQITKSKPSATNPFAHVFGNLYLVLTPPKNEGQSNIEDSFTDHTKNVILSNKRFDPENEYETATHFGKAIFSQYVEKNAGTIDFSGFEEILDRLTAVIDAHTKRMISPQKAPG